MISALHNVFAILLLLPTVCVFLFSRVCTAFALYNYVPECKPLNILGVFTWNLVHVNKKPSQLGGGPGGGPRGGIPCVVRNTASLYLY